jgi:hypothetical protein
MLQRDRAIAYHVTVVAIDTSGAQERLKFISDAGMRRGVRDLASDTHMARLIKAELERRDALRSDTAQGSR